jgi:hypothetical protein
MDNKKIKVIENKMDAVVFLNQMIILVDKRMVRLKRCILDLEEELKKYDENVKRIPYEDIILNERDKRNILEFRLGICIQIT